jgi:UPF0755 protein
MMGFARGIAVTGCGAFVGLVALGVAGRRVLHEAPATSGVTEPVEFRVAPGEGFAGIAKRLEDSGLIVSAERLRVLARLGRVDREIRAGTYELPQGAAPTDLLDKLVAGHVRLLRFMVPEGWRLDEIAALAEEALAIPAEDFIEAAKDPELRSQVGCTSETLEGYLFPETYFFPDGAAPSEVVATMVERFLDEWETLARNGTTKLTRHEVVTLASIVESETRVPEERARIASVYLNRIEHGWRLQADPTVRYALGKFTERLYYRDLKADSPFNTYRIDGLPPGAIGNPGRKSLQAVLCPLETCEDFYFVASGVGGHIFSRTHEEHELACATVRAAAPSETVSSAAVSTE